MQAFKVLMLTLALVTGIATAKASPVDNVYADKSVSLHGIWDCR
jgi:hypothetical protein